MKTQRYLLSALLFGLLPACVDEDGESSDTYSMTEFDRDPTDGETGEETGETGWDTGDRDPTGE